MISKLGNTYILSCDIHQEEVNETFFDFYEAVNFKKYNGWKSRKDERGEWIDVCPECDGVR